MSNNYTISARTLLPVHVGGGEEWILDAIDYVVKDGWFYRLDMGEMFASDPEFAREFTALAERESAIVHLRNLASRAFDPQQRRTWRFRARTGREFDREYSGKLSDARNQLLVHCMLHENARPVIPGSSIKGAFRTALLDHRIDHRKQAEYAPDARKIHHKYRAATVEGRILKALKRARGHEEFCIEKDPFRGVKVGDAILPEDCTRIEKVVNVAVSARGSSENVAMWTEVVNVGVVFQFTLSLLPPQQLELIEKRIDLNELFIASYNYFALALDEEDHNFYNANRSACREMQRVFDALDPDSSDETVLRLGRFSHLESMTFSGALRMPTEKSHRRGWGKTRNLVNGAVPLGAVKLMKHGNLPVMNT